MFSYLLQIKKEEVKKLKRLILLAAMVSLGVLTLTITPVSAAQDWTSSYLMVSDNSFVQGNHKNYSKEGTHRVIFSIDARNSTLGSNTQWKSL